MVNWSDIITDLARDWLPVIIVAIIGWIGVQLRGLFPTLKAKYETSLSEEQRKLVENVARIGVSMAEQIWKRPDVQDAAEEKRNTAFQFIDTWLSKYGIKMASDEIYDLIESAVHTELNKDKLQMTTLIESAGVVATGGQVIEAAPGKPK